MGNPLGVKGLIEGGAYSSNYGMPELAFAIQYRTRGTL